MNSQSSYRQNGSQTCPSEQDSGRLSARTSERPLVALDLPFPDSRFTVCLITMPETSSSPSPSGQNLDLQEIQQIVELMAANNLTLFQWERGDGALTLRRGHDIDGLGELLSKLPAPAAPLYGPAPVAHAAPAPTALAAPVAAAPAAVEEVGPAIHSPMVGTFYRASAPGEPLLVNVGDSVDENTTVCIIEAMKVMNEIKAETRGTIARLLVEDGKPVQYGQPLFQLK